MLERIKDDFAKVANLTTGNIIRRAKDTVNHNCRVFLHLTRDTVSISIKKDTSVVRRFEIKVSQGGPEGSYKTLSENLSTSFSRGVSLSWEDIIDILQGLSPTTKKHLFEKIEEAAEDDYGRSFIIPMNRDESENGIKEEVYYW